MKTFTHLLCVLILSIALFACNNAHFLKEEAYRNQVIQDFELKKQALPHGDLFAVFADSVLSVYEREALMFLYAYMPIGDVTDYPGDYYLENVRLSKQTRSEMPWGKEIPDEVFRHFVLPIRVNNENLDDSRRVFYGELKDRVKGLPMKEAILEVNHWCHEKVVYRPSDARTSSPLASVKTAYGRCGEESTFTVAALRAVGIPARQVYTPRWAHTDDNHAWVEAWADGHWYFFGACEPEPVLNLGWFNAPASRGMLMHTKVFGRYNGPEEMMLETPNYTEINVIDNYAPTAKAIVTVTDAEGQAVADAKVEFKIYNYAEFYTVATKYTDAEGKASLTAGKGDMLVWASRDGRFGYAKLSFGKDNALHLSLDKKEGETYSLPMDLIPPVEGANIPEVTPEQRAENDRRMAQEDSIRNAYVATMMTEKQAEEWVDKLYGNALQSEKKEKLADRTFDAAMELFKRKTERMAQIAYPVIKQVYETQGHMYENILIPITDGKRMYNISCNLKRAYETECKEVVKSFEKSILLHVIDEAWKENLRELDELKHSVQNASYEQKDPLLIYKLESVNLFDAMVNKINNQTISILMRGQIPVQEAPAEAPEAPQAPRQVEVRQAAPEQRQDMSKYREQKVDLNDPNQQAAAAQDTREQPRREPIRAEKTVGRNDPCPCGSGKKYKNCHGRNA